LTAFFPVLLKWIHLMATVAWIGGMFTNFFIYIPSLAKTMDPATAGKLMGTVMKRFRVMVYVSMAVFLLTGIMMATQRLDSGGFFPTSNQMVAILLLKVPLYILMVILAIVFFEFVAPKAARLAAEGPSPALQKTQKIQKFLAMTGFLLGVVVLALSTML
jgi:uncharacterized membrane protein